MIRRYIFYFILLLSLLGCKQKLVDSSWKSGLGELADSREKRCLVMLKEAEKITIEMGNKVSDTLLLDSLKLIYKDFNFLQLILDSTNVLNSKNIQDSINKGFSRMDFEINKLLGEGGISKIDSFQFLRIESNNTIRIKEEYIPEEYLPLYRMGVLLELIELKTVLMRIHFKRFIEFNTLGIKKIIVKANKNRVKQGELYRAKVFIFNEPNLRDTFKTLYDVDGKKFDATNGMRVDYSYLPKSIINQTEEYQTKTIKVNSPYLKQKLTYNRESSIPYTLKKKCTK